MSNKTKTSEEIISSSSIKSNTFLSDQKIEKNSKKNKNFFIKLKELYKYYLIYPKLVHFIFGLKMFSIYQYRGLFIKRFNNFTDKEYALSHGILMFLCFFLNLVNQRLFDTLNPRIFLIFILFLSSFSIRMIFYLPKYFFWPLFFIFVMVNALLPAIVDRISFSYFEENKISTSHYGSQKMFETLAYLVAGYISEKLTENHDFKKLVNYENLVTLPAIFLSFFISYKPQKIKLNFGNLKEFKQTKFVGLIFCILLFGTVRTGLSSLLTNYLVDVLVLKNNTHKGFIGERPLFIITTCSVTFELLFLRFSNKIISRFGLFIPVILAGVVQILRTICYCFIREEYENKLIFCALVENLKGMNFALTQAPMVQIVDFLIEKNKTLGFVIFNSFYTGISHFFNGVFLSSLLKESTFEYFRIYFFACSIVVLVGLIVFCIVFKREIFCMKVK